MSYNLSNLGKKQEIDHLKTQEEKYKMGQVLMKQEMSGQQIVNKLKVQHLKDLIKWRSPRKEEDPQVNVREEK